MKSTVESVSPTRVKLAVEVGFDELTPSLDAAYKRIGAQIRIPGFRPGKAPARIIDQRVGRGAVLEEAVNDALPRVYGAAVREAGVRAMGQPEIEVTNLDDGTSLSFTAEVDVRPEFELPDTSTIAVTVDAVEVSESDVDSELDDLRDRFSTLTGVERPVQAGDFVSVDLLAKVDGEEVEGGSANGLSYEVGSGDLIDGIDEAITGLDAGASVTFPTTLKAGERAGSDAEVTVTVNSVKERERPEADDDFAQLASEFDTIDELREDLRARVRRTRSLEQGSEARDKVLEALLDAVDIPLPESAVTAEVGYREHEIVHSLGHDDAVFDQYLDSVGQTREQFTEELRTSAQRSVKAQLILDALAEKQDVQVSDAELTEYLVRQSSRYGMSPQDFANRVVQDGNLTAMVADLRRNKALAGVLQSATITDSAGAPVDLEALSPTQLADEVAAAALDDGQVVEPDQDADAEGVEAEGVEPGGTEPERTEPEGTEP